MKLTDLKSTTEAARMLGVDASLVRRWIADGKIKYVRLGRNNFISLRVVESLKAQREAKQGTKDQAK